ncbi:hypothetical protein SAMN05192553_10566 [Cyclobacterium xiamenense]|uniref:Uncharacterized protein n=1 Tax=Cyclobacterium xiamenense TaxID=1297121 RepID=A0A1H6ZVP7_9BACT|nr:hypothetical protein [Cyclobacterium xiamenense]SEJ55677.1 hypothetical protein SAMN05192553_10566 [Cyclobacterium xiamenense]
MLVGRIPACEKPAYFLNKQSDGVIDFDGVIDRIPCPNAAGAMG